MSQACQQHKRMMKRSDSEITDTEAIVTSSTKRIKQGLEDLPTESANIAEVIATGYYVDKTKYAYKLMTGFPKAKFLVRPRRFGKSLFVSTLAAVANGEKELFAGDPEWDIPPCYIYDKYDWTKKYPVINLNFSDLKNCKDAQDLMRRIKENLYDIAEQYNVHLKCRLIETNINDPKITVEEYLKNLIITLSKLGTPYQNQVVVLVDEYDAPLVGKVKKYAQPGKEKPLDNFDVISSFFNAIKKQKDNGKVKLEFVTGVTRFELSDLGSEPNNLDDISIKEGFAAIAGYEEADITRIFSDYIDSVVASWGTRKILTNKNKQGETITAKEYVLQEMRKKYNGYKFYEDGRKDKSSIPTIFNPLSVMKFLESGMLDSHWIETGDTNRLLNQIRQDIEKFRKEFENEKITATKNELKYTQDSTDIDFKSLMFQTGYLTIDSYDEISCKYQLKYPNEEVEEALDKAIQKTSNNIAKEFREKNGSKLIKALEQEAWHRPFFECLYYKCFPQLPYSVIRPYESYCQGLLQIALLGGDLVALGEKPANIGRIDTITETDKKVYIFELKLNGSASQALQQTHEKYYSTGCFQKGKNVVLVGVNFVHTLCNNCKRNKKEPNCTACKKLPKVANHNNIDSFVSEEYDENENPIANTKVSGKFEYNQLKTEPNRRQG